MMVRSGLDEQTGIFCILKIELTHGVLFSNGTRYDIDFTARSVE